jgi:carbamoyl-phosphate synthase large subunit
MKKYKAILVTGCGGDIGTGIGRILKESGVAETLVGADIRPDNAGAFIFDVCEVLPRTDDPTYFKEVDRLIKKHSIELVIPMSEAEIRLWYRNGHTETFAGIPVVMPNSQVFDVAIDKLATAEFLKSHNLPYPWTTLVDEGAPRELPCIVKSRGTGDKGGVEMVDDSSVAYFSARRPGNIWQEYLEGEEYTAGVYGCMNGEIRTIVMKRKLSGGMTGYTMGGEVVDDTEITGVLTELARALNLRGSINAQLRMTKKGPVVFEINPRFSSTVVFRHKLGFKDVIWSLEEKAGGEASPYTPPKTGIKFYKGYTEYIAGT